MRFFLLLLALLIVLTTGVYGAGSALPEEMITIRGAQYKAPPEELWELVTNYPEMRRWNDSIDNVTALPDPETKETLWDMTDSDGRHLVLKVVVSEPMKLHRAEIIENDLPFLGSWQFEFTANDKGTWLKLTEHSRITNPFLRFATYYVLGSDYGTNAFLQAIGRHFLQEVEIKELAA
jgi:uncharacterized protein YndB with AHSA1/START domain